MAHAAGEPVAQLYLVEPGARVVSTPQRSRIGREGPMRWTAHSQPATSENQGVNLAVSTSAREVSSGSDAKREVMSRMGGHITLTWVRCRRTSERYSCHLWQAHAEGRQTR